MAEVRKQQNPNKVLNNIKALMFIRANGPVDVATISEQTGIALPTLYRTIKTLSDQRIIVVDGKEDSFAGRKAKLYSVNANYAYMLGIVLEKNYVKAFVAGMDGQIQSEYVVDLVSDLSQKEIISAFELAVEKVLEMAFRSQDGLQQISRIGVLSASAIDVTTGTITEFGGRPCLDGFEIVRYVQEKYQKPVKLMKVSAVEALAYTDVMNLQGIEQYLYIHIGQGVGVCLVVDGKLYEGKHGKAGEIEPLFTKIAKENGSTAPFTAWQLYDLVLEYTFRNPQSVLAQLVAKNTGKYESKQSVLRHSLDEALGMKDEGAMGLLSGTLQKWGEMISMLHVCFDPEVTIIGGDISERLPNLFGLIEGCVKDSVQTKLIPADSYWTNDMVFARSVLDDCFDDVQKQISSN